METGIATQVRGKINPGCSVHDEFAAAAEGSPLKGAALCSLMALVVLHVQPLHPVVLGSTVPFPPIRETYPECLENHPGAGACHRGRLLGGFPSGF